MERKRLVVCYLLVLALSGLLGVGLSWRLIERRRFVWNFVIEDVKVFDWLHSADTLDAVVTGLESQGVEYRLSHPMFDRPRSAADENFIEIPRCRIGDNKTAPVVLRFIRNHLWMVIVTEGKSEDIDSIERNWRCLEKDAQSVAVIRNGEFGLIRNALVLEVKGVKTEFYRYVKSVDF
jgi:hypothetical protein